MKTGRMKLIPIQNGLGMMINNEDRKFISTAMGFVLLCVSAILLWVAAFCIYEGTYNNDSYQAIQLHTEFLFAFSILIFVFSVALTRYRSWSIGWPISMLVIAMLLSALAPFGVRAESTIREQLDLSKYFEFGRRTIGYAVFSGLQVLGYLLAAANGRHRNELTTGSSEQIDVQNSGN